MLSALFEKLNNKEGEYVSKEYELDINNIQR